MRTYPLHDARGMMFAFEIDNVFGSHRGLARMLSETEGVDRVRKRRLFGPSPDVHITFRFDGRPFMVLEPYGDNSRYWVGPDDLSDPAAQSTRLDVRALEQAFRRHQPPIGLAWLAPVVITAWTGYRVAGSRGVIVVGVGAVVLVAARVGQWRRASPETKG